MSIDNIGKWLSSWALLGFLALGGVGLLGCQSASSSSASKPHFADLPSGMTSSVPSTAQIAPAPASPSPTPAPVTPTVAAVHNVAVDPVPAPAAAAGSTNSASNYSETLRIGDSLTVIFTDTPIVIPPYEEKIKEDGTITLTLNQIFKAAGKTIGQLEQEIRARYVPDYYKIMTVAVRHQESTRWYYVDGEVKTPSRQIYTSRTTVTKAIASAGGFTDFANKKNVRLTRVDGRTFTVNCVKALDNPTLDLEIFPGDKIYVKRSIW
jgi:polysaccharide export outer membrane protein